MVGFFSDLSDTDDSAVDDIISQAKDACVLEQVSAINCSSFTDSVLPTHLESRFHKLKSFPATSPRPRRRPKPGAATPPPHDSRAENFSASNSTSFHHPVRGSDFSPSQESPKLQHGYASVSSLSDSVDSSHVKNGLESKSKLGKSSPGSDSGSSSHGSKESSLSSMFKPEKKNDEGKGNKVKSVSLSSSPSPPRRAGCFWCSPKKDSKKKSKEIDWGVLGWDKSDELLSDLGSFSTRQQQKMLKKAMKEEQKISREAEKIVEWAKQASARMNVSVIDDDDELSDKD